MQFVVLTLSLFAAQIHDAASALSVRVTPKSNDPVRRFQLSRSQLDELQFLSLAPWCPYFDMPLESLYSDLRYGGSISTLSAAYRKADELAMIREPKIVQDRRESRAIVTRRTDAKTPTWDGSTPAFVFSPLIWYFDSPCNVDATWQIAFPSIPQSIERRRTYLEFLQDEDPYFPWHFNGWH